VRINDLVTRARQGFDAPPRPIEAPQRPVYPSPLPGFPGVRRGSAPEYMIRPPLALGPRLPTPRRGDGQVG
jgi:hypothetical protein